MVCSPILALKVYRAAPATRDPVSLCVRSAVWLWVEACAAAAAVLASHELPRTPVYLKCMSDN